MPNEENDVSTENFKDEKIQELEAQLQNRVRECDENLQRIEDLEQKNYNLQNQVDKFREQVERLQSKNQNLDTQLKDAKTSGKKLDDKQRMLESQMQTQRQQLLLEQAKMAAANSNPFTTTANQSNPFTSVQSQAFTPSTNPPQQFKPSIPEVTTLPEPKAESPNETGEQTDSSAAVDELRGRGIEMRPTNNCQQKYVPKWAATLAWKRMLVEAFDDERNTVFNHICETCVRQFSETALENGWKDMKCFIQAIYPVEEYVYDDVYKKTLYFEYDLAGKWTCIFFKMDLDRKEDKKYAYPIIEKIKKSKHSGFAILIINDNGSCDGMV